MTKLELLAPARNMDIGIAAIDCGADAVYIAGPAFGARQAAGNSIEDIKQLCNHAHKFGAKIFVALNTILYDNELEDAYKQMLEVQEAGADALIIQDFSILKMASEGIENLKKEFNIPLHASTQCAIRTPQQAKFLERLGFSRLILEREISLEQIKAIHKAVDCELEFFVHGALCVCYSGQCYLSEMIDHRSANRGACMQACRSRYNLIDGNGKTIVKDSALLSLKDYKLIDRVEELSNSGITSFKIEGRLKNISYVKNVVSAYSQALNKLVQKNPEKWCRASSGKTICNFTPDLDKTFNRGYTSLFIDGKRGKWASGDFAKSMGEEIGKVSWISKNRDEVRISSNKENLVLANGDGFSYIARNGKVQGFRGDICKGLTIKCKDCEDLYVGCKIFRNIDSLFEKELEKSSVKRIIDVQTNIKIVRTDNGSFTVQTQSISEDGRVIEIGFNAGKEVAQNRERMLSMLKSQLGKTAEIYQFHVDNIDCGSSIPFMSASFINNIRRNIAQTLSSTHISGNELANRNKFILKKNDEITLPEELSYKQNIANHISQDIYKACGATSIENAYELSHEKEAELMRTKYCIKYELGMCPTKQGAKATGPLFLTNNGMKLSLIFDCKNCEMVIKKA